MSECGVVLGNGEGCNMAICSREEHEDEWHEANGVWHDGEGPGKDLRADIKWRTHRKEACVCPWHDEAVATYPNTSHRHAEVMLRVHQDERIPIVYNAEKGELLLRPFTEAEEQYIDGGPYPPGWETNVDRTNPS